MCANNSSSLFDFFINKQTKTKISVTPITTPLKSSRIEEIVQEWYAEFVDVEQIMLFELVTAANFMDIKALLDLTCLAVSVLIKVSYFLVTRLVVMFELFVMMRHLLSSDD